MVKSGVSWKNFKSNWYLAVSAAAYFCVNLQFSLNVALAVLLSVLAVLYICSSRYNIFASTCGAASAAKLLAFFSSVGICVFGVRRIFLSFDTSNNLNRVIERLNLNADVVSAVVMTVVILGLVASLPALYTALTVFWMRMSAILARLAFKDVKTWEYILYGALVLIFIAYSASVIVSSEMFYKPATYNVLYTCDTETILSENAYMSLYHTENDIRQPLFAVFAAPFISPAYLLAAPFNSLPVTAVFMNSVQICMLFATYLILANAMKLTPGKRALFICLACATYSFLLASVMIEQYIVAFFWLSLLAVDRQATKNDATLELVAASGVILTNVVLAPCVSEHSPVKQFGLWFKDMFRLALVFIFAIVAFARTDVFITLYRNLTNIVMFTGDKIGFVDRIMQYSQFVSTCFTAPPSSVVLATDMNTLHYAWRQCAVESFNCIGIILMALALLGFIVSRKKAMSTISLVWVVYSFVVLCLIGWGTAENGLVLYALYFTWAFMILIFRLFEAIAEKLRANWLLASICLAVIVLMLCVNIPQIRKMLSFAMEYFPVRA